MADFIGTSGDDSIKGTAGPDHFDLSQGGSDFARGGGGDDVFYMGGAYDATDTLNGIQGHDTIELDGDYSAGLTYTPQQNYSIETIQLDGGHDYNLTIAHDLILLTYDASRLQAGDTAIIDSSHAGWQKGETIFLGGAGTDEFTALAHGRFIMGAGLQAEDRLYGGRGADGVVLNGDYSAGLVLDNDTLQKVGDLALTGGHDYRITLASNDDGKNFGVGGEGNDGGTIVLDGSLTKHGLYASGDDGTDTLIGGRGADHLSGAEGDDKLVGGADGDTLTGGAGADRFFYLDVKDSTAAASDLITDLDASDTLYLQPIDADVHTNGNQAFHLVGAFSGQAGELTVSYDSGTGFTTVAGDVDGDGSADLVIRITGDHHDFTNFAL